jgi:hypothetical protein
LRSTGNREALVLFKKTFQKILGAFFQGFSQGLLHQVTGGLLVRGFVYAGF